MFSANWQPGVPKYNWVNWQWVGFTNHNKHRHSGPDTHFQRRITDCSIVFQINKYVNLQCFLNICKHIMVFLCFSQNPTYSTFKNVIDDIAPIKVCKKTGRQKSFGIQSTAVQSMKRQCRKAERMWRKTKLEIHYSIYKDSLHAFNVKLATARQTFFLNLINSNLNNTRILFATVERRQTPPPQVRFPVKCSPTANANASPTVCFLLF